MSVVEEALLKLQDSHPFGFIIVTFQMSEIWINEVFIFIFIFIIRSHIYWFKSYRMQYTFQVLYNTPEAVAMGSNQHPLALLDLRHDLFIPERKSTSNGVLQAFTRRKLVLSQVSITPVLQIRKV